MIYFDNASTSFPKPPEVYDFINKFNRKQTFNIQRGNYTNSLNTQNVVIETRKLLIDLVNADQKLYETIFTPSATIALNMVIQGLNYKNVKNVYITPFEHNAVLRTLNYLQNIHKFDIIRLDFSKNDLKCRVEGIKNQFIKSPPDILIMSHVSNVCGYITPILEIAKLAKIYNAIVIVDGAQSVGLVDIDMSEKSIDFLVFAGHKTLFSIFGSAGFVMKKSITLSPIIFGGTGINSTSKSMPETLPEKFEAGSLNILAIAGLNASLKWINSKTVTVMLDKEQNLASKLKECLRQFSNIKIVGENSGTGIVSCAFETYSPDEVGQIFNQKEIAVRTGLHCAPDAHKFLGTFPAGTVRFSLSCFNTVEEIEYLEKVFEFIYDNS